MVEIKLINQDDFLKIAETLTRIGIASNKEKKLYQSCHILQKQKRYYIVHFKELLELDGRKVNFDKEDKLRRNNIAKLLADWGLCEIISDIETAPQNNFRVISYKQKSEWTLVHKYRIGN